MTVWFKILSCCLQKPKAVCPLPYLTSKVPPNLRHFKASDFGSPPSPSPQDIFPNAISRASFSNSFLFYGVPCAKCTNFFAGRGMIVDLDMFVGVLFPCLCCCRCTKAKRSPLSIIYLFFFCLFLSSQFCSLPVSFAEFISSHFQFPFSVSQFLLSIWLFHFSGIRQTSTWWFFDSESDGVLITLIICCWTFSP